MLSTRFPTGFPPAGFLAFPDPGVRRKPASAVQTSLDHRRLHGSRWLFYSVAPPVSPRLHADPYWYPFSARLQGAHFPVAKGLEDFEFGRVKGIGKSEAANLLDCRWIDTRENLLFFGPPGIGKTHLAIAFGRIAVEKGYKVCFERVTNLIKLLKTAEVQKTSEYRIRRLMKSDLVLIDEIGYTPIEKREANLFFNMISELYEKASIIITSNKSFDAWAEMMGDTVMTTALLDRLLHHAKVFTLDGESYRIKKPRKEA